MKDINIAWKDLVKKKAVQETAKRYGITTQEVIQVLRLARAYIQAQIAKLDFDGDLREQITRFQIPFFGGFYYVPRAVIIENMYLNGHISEEQFDKYVLQTTRIDTLNRFKKRLKNYGKAIRENERDNGNTIRRKN